MATKKNTKVKEVQAVITYTNAQTVMGKSLCYGLL